MHFNKTGKTGVSEKVVQKTQGAVERNEDLIKDSADYIASKEYQTMIVANQEILRNPR